MRIVHVVRQFYPAVGGIETVVLELASAQIAEGHSVRIVTLDRLFNAPQAPKLSSHDRVAGAEIVRIPFFGLSRYPIAPSVLRHVGDADVVHVHAIDFFFDYLAWTKPLHRKRLIVSTHGGFFHTPFAARLKRLYFSTVTRLSLACYDGVAAVSAPDRELFAKIRKRTIDYIENGVNVAKYANAASPVPAKSILALGRLSSNKRLDRLISFIAALRRRDPEWKLIIAGRAWDVDADALRALAEAQRIGDAVEIVSAPQDQTVRELMGRCSVIASASDYEGFGIAAVEGLSAGLLPLLSNIPAFRHLVARAGTGILADFTDPEGAAVLFIRRWRELAVDYPQQRKRSIDAAAQYEWRRVVSAYAALYDRVSGAKVRTILGVPIGVNTRSQAVELLDARFVRGKPAIVAFANAHTLNVASRDEAFRDVLRNAIVINDGIGVDIASRFLFGSAFPQNLNGTDFTPHYLRSSRHRFRIFLLGGRGNVARRAGKQLARMCPQHRIVGWHHGFLAKADNAKIAEMIRHANADVVLVAMGNPVQEQWLAANLAATGCRLGFAVGALFDFMTGQAPRAPLWMRTVRLEWLHRLMLEPARLWRRYLVGNPQFLLRVLRQWISGARGNSLETA
jgi:alpha-1,3-mannosyltransferase